MSKFHNNTYFYGISDQINAQQTLKNIKRKHFENKQTFDRSHNFKIVLYMVTSE